MLGTFHQLQSILHKKVTSIVTKNGVSESIVYMRAYSKFPPNCVIICNNVNVIY